MVDAEIVKVEKWLKELEKDWNKAYDTYIAKDKDNFFQREEAPAYLIMQIAKSSLKEVTRLREGIKEILGLENIKFINIETSIQLQALLEGET